jgi:hypothetical protein
MLSLIALAGTARPKHKSVKKITAFFQPVTKEPESKAAECALGSDSVDSGSAGLVLENRKRKFEASTEDPNKPTRAVTASPVVTEPVRVRSDKEITHAVTEPVRVRSEKEMTPAVTEPVRVRSDKEITPAITEPVRVDSEAVRVRNEKEISPAVTEPVRVRNEKTVSPVVVEPVRNEKQFISHANVRTTDAGGTVRKSFKTCTLGGRIIIVQRSPKVDRARPPEWVEIGKHAQIFGIPSAIKNYQALLKDYSPGARRAAVKRWEKDSQSQENVERFNLGQRQRESVLGKDFEDALMRQVLTRNEAGLPVDSIILMDLIGTELKKRDMTELTQENGGKYTFGHSWCSRFLKRHGLATRATTTKMRKLPAEAVHRDSEAHDHVC